MIKLYSYFRSSSSYRVRIALNLKNLDYEIIPVHLLNNGGEQFSDDFSTKNAAHRIPVLDHDGQCFAQSTSIIEYLDETFPEVKLYPSNPDKKAFTRQLCEIVNSDIQPLQNLSVLKKLVKDHGFSDDEKVKWIQHWMNLGFQSYEHLLGKTAGEFCVGDQPSAADCFLIPQVFNAIRWGVDLGLFPTISRINDKAIKLPAFEKAHPDNQPDTPK